MVCIGINFSLRKNVISKIVEIIASSIKRGWVVLNEDAQVTEARQAEIMNQIQSMIVSEDNYVV